MKALILLILLTALPVSVTWSRVDYDSNPVHGRLDSVIVLLNEIVEVNKIDTVYVDTCYIPRDTTLPTSHELHKAAILSAKEAQLMLGEK